MPSLFLYMHQNIPEAKLLQPITLHFLFALSLAYVTRDDCTLVRLVSGLHFGKYT